MWIDRRVPVAVAAASLLLNVFLGGAVLGRWFGERHAAVAPPRPGAGVLVPPAHVQALPPDERRLFRAAMAPHRPAIKTAREAHRAARRQIEADIAAADFEAPKVAADFQQLRRTNQDIEEAVDAALVDALATLKPDSRAALVAHAQVERPRAPPRP